MGMLAALTILVEQGPFPFSSCDQFHWVIGSRKGVNRRSQFCTYGFYQVTG
jgi:hypothetical protein